jgi:hypothetical protein
MDGRCDGCVGDDPTLAPAPTGADGGTSLDGAPPGPWLVSLQSGRCERIASFNAYSCSSVGETFVSVGASTETCQRAFT